MWGNTWTWSYWDDEEKKPKNKSSSCDHIWVEKPLFTHIHKMCDVCGLYYEEHISQQNIKQGENID